MDETQPPIKPDRSHRQDLVKLSWRIRLASCSVDGLWSLRAKDQRIAAYSICERTPGAGGNLSHILDLRAEHPWLQHNTLSALVASARSSFRSSCNSHVTIDTQDYLDSIVHNWDIRDISYIPTSQYITTTQAELTSASLTQILYIASTWQFVTSSVQCLSQRQRSPPVWVDTNACYTTLNGR